MIYYFSGEGNSRFAAKRLSSKTKESLRFIPLENPATQKPEGESIGIVFPIYSWGLPVPVVDFINLLPDSFFEEIKKRAMPVWMVCTCGDETGNAPEIF